MADQPLPTSDELRQLLRYEPETGKLYWRERQPGQFRQAVVNRFNATFAGKEARTLSNGYLTVGLNNWRGRRLSLRAHRVAWCIHYGEWPSDMIDHIDGDSTNNRIANLRVVSAALNVRNMRRDPRNTSGVSGVWLHKGTGKWRAMVRVKEYYWAALFDDIADAEREVVSRRRKLGFTERHGT